IFQTGGQGVAGSGTIVDRVKQVKGVRAATPFVLQQVLFSSAGGGAHGGIVRGVDLDSSAVVSDMRTQVKSGTLEPLVTGAPAILLGAELARTLGVVPGESVTLISPQGALTAVGMVPKMRRYTVSGTIEIGMYEYDSSIAYLALPAAQEFAGLGPAVAGVEVELVDPFPGRR